MQPLQPNRGSIVDAAGEESSTWQPLRISPSRAGLQ